MPELGVYVHFPWCRRLCPYCDFPVAVTKGEPPHDDYLAAVLAELADQAPGFAGRTLVSIYLGGGTPSLWRPDCLATLIDRVATRWAADPGALEITLEANPIDCTAERMAAWRAAGINRLSIGVQSLDAAELDVLGRDHLMGDGAAALAAATGAGFASVSADLILGTPPGLGLVPLGRRSVAVDGAPPSVASVATSGVDHLSVYELTIEDRTAFGTLARRGELVPLDEDVLATLYQVTHDELLGRGFQHYEVSSYARPGRRARHNSLYWQGAEFLGLGTGAASFWRADDGSGRRWTNQRAAARYLAATGADRIAEDTALDAAAVATDLLWLAMRTTDGAAAAALATRPGVTTWLQTHGLVELIGDRVSPTLRGFLYADQIAARIVASTPRS